VKPTETPTETPTTTPVPEKDIFPASWNQLFSDKFDDNQNGWTVEVANGDWGVLNPKINNGKYQIFLKSGEHGVRLPLYQTKLNNIKNYYISVDVEGENLRGAYYGIEFRTSDNAGYVLLIDIAANQYTLGYSDESGWDTLTDWTTTSSIKSDQVNNIGVVVIDKNIQVIINGNELEKIEDSHKTTEGGFGLTVGLYDGNQQVTTLFDNLVVYGP
jgi:hypothetical protein